MSKEECEKFDAMLKAKDKTELINYSVGISNDKRQELRKGYKEAMGRELMEALEKELSGDFEDCMVKLFKDPFEADAEDLKKSTKGLGTDEELLIEMVVSRTSDELVKIKEKYKELYNVTLEEDIADDTSGDFLNLLKALINTERSKNEKPKKSLCTKIAKELYDSAQNKQVNKENVINYFSTLSPKELKNMCQEYHKLSGQTIMEFIDKQFSGDFKDCLKTLVYAVISPSEYFATKIMKSIKGAGTNEALLNRCIVSRYNKDMKDIKGFFNKLYNKDMMDEVADDLSGDYLTVIKALVSFKS